MVSHDPLNLTSPELPTQRPQLARIGRLASWKGFERPEKLVVRATACVGTGFSEILADANMRDKWFRVVS